MICSYFYAPEWTRTTTPYTQDKALNFVRPRHMCPPASRSSYSSGFADASDASDELTFVKDLSRSQGAPSRSFYHRVDRWALLARRREELSEMSRPENEIRELSPEE
jgi:hypothetical protein